MNRRNVILLLSLIITLTGWSTVSSDRGIPAEMPAASSSGPENDKDFLSFLDKFGASSSFQYSRIRFPLESPIVLLNEKDEEETFPFSKEKWLLLDRETFKERRIKTEEDGAYITKFVVNEATHKEFEAWYEESELDLQVIFNLIDGEWHVTDCYNSCYAFDLPAEGLGEAIEHIQEENKLFAEKYP